MGYKVPRRNAIVTFEDGHDYYGAEITLSLDLPISLLFELQKLREDGSDAAIRLFADDVVEAWNLEDDSGQPLPANFEGASTLPAAFISALMDRWVQVATAAPAPLGQTSSDTAGSVVPLTQTGT